MDLPNGVMAWTWSSSKYVQEAIRNVEPELAKRVKRLRKGMHTPFSANYRPEIDTSPQCDDEDSKLYLLVIDGLRWVVEIGRVDITCEVSLMSSISEMPGEGNLSQLFHIFAYLQQHHSSRLVFDPTYPEILKEEFPCLEWKDHFDSLREEVPDYCPRPFGKEMITWEYVDEDFAGETITRRSRTGFIIMLN